jgi:hypothetical protein
MAFGKSVAHDSEMLSGPAALVTRGAGVAVGVGGRGVGDGTGVGDSAASGSAVGIAVSLILIEMHAASDSATITSHIRRMAFLRRRRLTG